MLCITYMNFKSPERSAGASHLKVVSDLSLGDLCPTAF